MSHVSCSVEVEFERAGKLCTVCLHTALKSDGSSISGDKSHRETLLVQFLVNEQRDAQFFTMYLF
jgi:hypothetical protein